ncbi:unknown protein [Seminavis robusta]|uniref:Uncharacterized protein n=1 Tax=Seminavis robusta TaxID=568900 RepID=A0A9N8HDU9_9STRA|nr:unknown protein [Seminavis robusta]
MTKLADPRLIIVINILIVSWLGCWQISSRLLQVAPRAADATLDDSLDYDAGNVTMTIRVGNETVDQNDPLSLLVQANISASSTEPPTPVTITTNLPAWMQEYATWHQETRAQLNETNWNTHYRYLVMVARRGEQNQSNLVDLLEQTFARGRKQDIVRLANATVMICEMQANDYGQEWLGMFRHMWHWAFTPAPPIAQRVKDNFDRLGIVPGEYAAAHIRAVYAVKERSEKEMTQMTHHAMNCISMLRPGGPFFVASDTAFAVKTAIEYGRSKNVTVWHNQQWSLPEQPLHLDMYDAKDPSLVPEDFYDAFVDLYLLGSTRCVAHGQGSFGHWGYLLGYNSTCEIRHRRGPSVLDSGQDKTNRPTVSRKSPHWPPAVPTTHSYDSIYSPYAYCLILFPMSFLETLSRFNQPTQY